MNGINFHFRRFPLSSSFFLRQKKMKIAKFRSIPREIENNDDCGVVQTFRKLSQETIQCK